MEVSLPKKLLAEGFGTFCLVFAGTGAIIINELSGGAVTQLGVALTFGLIVFAMIATVGDVSGAHLNPAVTFGFYLAGRFPGQAVVPYVISQCCGAIMASVILFEPFALQIFSASLAKKAAMYFAWSCLNKPACSDVYQFIRNMR